MKGIREFVAFLFENWTNRILVGLLVACFASIVLLSHLKEKALARRIDEAVAKQLDDAGIPRVKDGQK